MNKDIKLNKEDIKQHNIYTEVKDGKLYILSVCTVNGLCSKVCKEIEIKDLNQC